MKKHLFIFLFLLSILLVGCVNFSTLSSTETTENTSSNITNIETSTTITTETPTTVLTNPVYSWTLLSGVDTVEINSSWVDEGALFIIHEESQIVYSSDMVDVTQKRIYQVEYEVIVEYITYSIVRYVAVVDQTPPLIRLNLGVDTVKLGTSWTDASVTATDNSLEVLEVVTSGTVNVDIVGTYQITYTATDSSGNTSEAIRFVTVIE